MHYLYTGDFSFKEKDRSNIDNLIDILRIADEEFLEEVKMMCEERLIKLCSMDNFVDICQVADMYNANRLKEFCAWFQRINPKVNELLYAQMQEENSIDNVGKEKQKLNSANMFGFLDCKNMQGDDDSSMQGDAEYEQSCNESALESDMPATN